MMVQMANKLEMAVLSGCGHINKGVCGHITCCLAEKKFPDRIQLIPFF